MKIYYDLQQGSPEWADLRAKNFTASELGDWILEPLKINLTVEEIKAKIDECGLSRKGVTKRDDLIAVLSDAGFSPEPELCEGARTAILRKIKQERFARLSSLDYDQVSEPEQIWLDRERELADQSERMFERNIPVKYGNLLEPYARDLYQEITGHEVEQAGFIEHDDGGFGCSPDGIIWDRAENPNRVGHHFGLEIKCPIPETHNGWLLVRDSDGSPVLPDCHALQVHASMAVTGFARWDFISYCPTEKELVVSVLRDDYTERVLAGLKTMVAEKAKMKARLARIWEG